MGTPLTIDRFASKNIIYSPYGYVIMEDGTVYTLHKQWYHGIALAVLFPEKAKESGLESPEEEPDVFKYQRFELDHHNDFPVIRVCPFRMTTPCSINKGNKPATKAQIESLRAIFKILGLKARDMVNTDFCDCTVAQCYEMLNLENGSDEIYKIKSKAMRTRREDRE